MEKWNVFYKNQNSGAFRIERKTHGSYCFYKKITNVIFLFFVFHGTLVYTAIMTTILY